MRIAGSGALALRGRSRPLPMRLALLAASASVLTACAVTPPPALPPTHPASPQAVESPRSSASTDLAIDEATQTTASLLAPPQPGAKP